MKYKFNPFERAVGLFLLVSIFGSFFFGVGIAVKKNWFEEKIYFTTSTDSASNIRSGSSVEMSGLKIGRIEDVDLDENLQINVRFSILKKYAKMMKTGVKAQFSRSFIIGDKVLSLTKSENTAPLLAEGAKIPSEEAMDLMDLMTGDKFQSMLGKLEKTLNNLNETVGIGKDIALQLGDKKQLKVTLDNMAFASKELRKFIPQIVDNAPTMTKDVAQIVRNLTVITDGLKDMQPVMKDMAKNFPEGSKKAMEALNESVVVLRAMQKSFMLKGAVEELKKEEGQRSPASQKKD
jgi:phospholipid/cholesterol/gamma-HCH transport system substrate-binding protein